MGREVKITAELIFEGQSERGGWSRAQVEALGIPWPLRPGWISRAVGNEVVDEAVQEFLSLKNAHIDGDFLELLRQKQHLRSI